MKSRNVLIGYHYQLYGESGIMQGVTLCGREGK